MIRFKVLSSNGYLGNGAKWISNPQSNGEFTYYFVIELMDMWEAVGKMESPKKYHISLTVISPSEAGEENLIQAIQCYGSNAIAQARIADLNDNIKVEVLHSYYGGVPVWQYSGNAWKTLYKDALHQAQMVGMLFGFYMDRPINGIGETGWEALKMTPIKEVLDRVLKDRPTPEQLLMGKLEGVSPDED